MGMIEDGREAVVDWLATLYHLGLLQSSVEVRQTTVLVKRLNSLRSVSSLCNSVYFKSAYLKLMLFIKIVTLHDR